MASSFLFLGIGHPDRGDDSVGPFVAGKLAQDLGARGVEVLDHSGEGASLIDLWRDRQKTVIVDAMKTGGALGSVRRFDAVNEKLNSGVFRYSSHLFGLAEAVEMARVLKRLPESLIIYGIESILFSLDITRFAR